MNIKIEGNRCRTTSAYNVRVLRALSKLEGMKRWGAERTLSFENTPYNLEIWRQTFPEATIEGGMPIAPTGVVADAPFDLKGDRPRFAYRTQPRAHQKAALEKLAGKPAVGLFMDIGTGKSWTAIAMIGMRWCAGQSDHVLLIAKNGVHQQWVSEQIPQHISPVVHWKAWVWKEGKAASAKFEAMLKFDGLKIFAINIDAIRTKKAETAILRFLQAANGNATIIEDESQDIKNLSSERTKAAIKFRKLCKYAMIMTGTPIAKDLVDLFSQFAFLDESIIGHRYMTTFKNQYCVLQPNPFSPKPKVVGHKNVEELYKRIDPYIFRITTEEALDLPPKVFISRPFVLSAEQIKIMKDLKEQFFSDFGNDDAASVRNAASLLTKLQQVSCGFLPMDDGSFRELPNPRLEELLTILEQREGKAIVWCRFNRDIINVKNAMNKIEPGSAVDYYGNTSAAMRNENKDNFLDPKSGVRYLVASPEAAGTGLNLQGICRTNVYYSNSFNSLARWQSEGRTWRDGTTGTVTYFDLVARKSPDAKILANLRAKKDISTLTLDDYRKLLLMEEEDEI